MHCHGTLLSGMLQKLTLTAWASNIPFPSLFQVRRTSRPKPWSDNHQAFLDHGRLISKGYKGRPMRFVIAIRSGRISHPVKADILGQPAAVTLEGSP